MREELPSILFVEDESEVRFELKRFLQRYSREVITANHGEEGFTLFKLHQPDIVISDIKMPKMNGIDMAKEIKKISPDQIIIFTTAHSDNKYFLEAIEMQVDGYILKPVDLGLLKKKIKNINKHIVLKKEKKLYESILDDIAQMQDTMLAVYDEKNQPVFYNKKLLTFLGHTSFKDFLKHYQPLSKKFEFKKECYSPVKNSTLTWIEDIRTLKVDKRIISMKGEDSSEEKIFLVSLSDKTQSNHTIVTFSEITSVIEEKDQYRHDAHTDALTQIDNRAKFNIIFDKAIKESKSKQSTLSIALLDIDNFKEVNDNYGHVFGDNVLKTFTMLVMDNIRYSDAFSRWGGEEFVLLLSDTTPENSKKIAENLRNIIEQYDFGMDKKLTCSFGIATAKEKDTRKSLFERADKALYRAKSSGRNKVEVCK